MNFYEYIGFNRAFPVPRSGVSVAPKLENASVFLDFDGTLVDIADRPDAVVVEPDLETILDELYDRTGGRTVLVSGRSLDVLSAFLPRFSGIMIGSHGAERRGAGLPEISINRPEGLCCVREVMEAYANHHEGLLLEEKPYSIVLHFRLAPELQLSIEPMLETLVTEWDDLVLHRAKMALEVMSMDVSKRAAVAALYENWPDTVPVAIGDDTTDEGMLSFVVEAGGVGVKVGAGQTAASCRLESPQEVLAFLQDWIAGRQLTK